MDKCVRYLHEAHAPIIISFTGKVHWSPEFLHFLGELDNGETTLSFNYIIHPITNVDSEVAQLDNIEATDNKEHSYNLRY